MDAEEGRASRVLWNDVLCTVIEEPDDTRLLIEVPGQGVAVVRSDEVLAVRERAVETSTSVLACIPKEDWDPASQRAEVLRGVLEGTGPASERVASAANQLDVTERHVYRLLGRFQDTLSVTALLPEKVGRKAGTMMLGPDKELVLHQLIQEHFLQKEQASVASVSETIGREFRAKGWDEPSYGTVKRRIEALDPANRDRQRLGAKVARLLHQPAAGHVNVSAPLERVEIDHTLMDVIVRSDDPSSNFRARPHLTLAVCVFTKCVLGFHIGFEPPSALSIALCLVHAAYPKDLAGYGLEGQWPMYGMPQSITVDNGKDFHSEAFRRGCAQHGIILSHRPVGSPHYGGTIERLIGTFMRKAHVLPGTTKESVGAKGEYDAVANATLTLSELRRWFIGQVIAYHNSEHRMLRKPPADAWSLPNPAPLPKQQDILVSFLPGDSRVLSRTGVHLHNLQYWCEELQPFTTRKPRVQVVFDPRDITRAYVRLPDGSVATAQLTDRSIPAISLAEWDMRRALERAAAKSPDRMAARDVGNGYSADVVAQAKAARKVKRRYENRTSGDSYAPPPLPTPPKSEVHVAGAIPMEPVAESSAVVDRLLADALISANECFEVYDYE